MSGPCVCVIGRKNGKCWSLRLGRMPKGAHNTPRTKPLGSSTPRATWCVSSLFSVSLLVRCETVESFALVGIGCDCQSLPLLLAMIKHITYKKHIIHTHTHSLSRSHARNSQRAIACAHTRVCHQRCRTHIPTSSPFRASLSLLTHVSLPSCAATMHTRAC